MWVYRSHFLVKKPLLGYIVQVIVIIHKAWKMAKCGRLNDRSKDLLNIISFCSHIYSVPLATVHSPWLYQQIECIDDLIDWSMDLLQWIDWSINPLINKLIN